MKQEVVFNSLVILTGGGTDQKIVEEASQCSEWELDEEKEEHCILILCIVVEQVQTPGSQKEIVQV